MDKKRNYIHFIKEKRMPEKNVLEFKSMLSIEKQSLRNIPGIRIERLKAEK